MTAAGRFPGKDRTGRTTVHPIPIAITNASISDFALSGIEIGLFTFLPFQIVSIGNLLSVMCYNMISNVCNEQ